VAVNLAVVPASVLTVVKYQKIYATVWFTLQIILGEGTYLKPERITDGRRLSVSRRPSVTPLELHA
jgi:hypothetical protein